MTITINPPSKASTYPQTIVTLHWLTVLLIAGAFAAIEIRGYYPKGSDMRGLLTMIHQSLGSLVLLLTVVRIAIRSQTPTPPIIPAPPAWQHAIASLTHLILYAALLAMPLLGWLMTSAGGHPIPFFGLSFPPIIGENKELAHTLEEVHEFIGNALYYIIGLHALAALVHHYINKDNTLTRMLSAAR